MAEMKNQDNDNDDDKTCLKRETFAFTHTQMIQNTRNCFGIMKI